MIVRHKLCPQLTHRPDPALPQPVAMPRAGQAFTCRLWGWGGDRKGCKLASYRLQLPATGVHTPSGITRGAGGKEKKKPSCNVPHVRVSARNSMHMAQDVQITQNNIQMLSAVSARQAPAEYRYRPRRECGERIIFATRMQCAAWDASSGGARSKAVPQQRRRSPMTRCLLA